MAEAEDVRKLVKENIGRRVRAGDLEVPVLPHIAQQVLSLIGDPDVSAKAMVKLIEKDQQLSARLLKVANSPVYAGPIPVTSIQRAVVTVGMRALRDLVFSIAMGERIFRSKQFLEPMRLVWEHSLAVAATAQELARIKQVNSDDAFLCGLLHDIGKSLLLETLSQISRRSNPPAHYSIPLIEEVMRDYHPTVGALMARAWNFSDLLYVAIRFHHEYDQAGAAHQMALVVHVADLFARNLGLSSYTSEPEFDLTQEPAVNDLQLNPREISSLLKYLPKTIRGLIHGME